MKEEELKKHIDIIYDHWYETNRFYHIWAKTVWHNRFNFVHARVNLL